MLEAIKKTTQMHLNAFDYIRDICDDLWTKMIYDECDVSVYDKISRYMLQSWLSETDTLQKKLDLYNPDCTLTSLCDKLQQRVEEINWILAPAQEALNHQKLVDLRDEAIDDLRAGLCISDGP